MGAPYRPRRLQARTSLTAELYLLLPCRRLFVATTTLHDDPGLAQNIHMPQRIAPHCDDVGKLSRGDGPGLARGAHDACCVEGHLSNDGHRLYPEFANPQIRLHPRGLPRHLAPAADVGAEDDLDAEVANLGDLPLHD